MILQTKTNTPLLVTKETSFKLLNKLGLDSTTFKKLSNLFISNDEKALYFPSPNS